MKNSVPIPSDVWEAKKALIATLYKDEEWPLKQVIKKIRSDNFNPSETQLRSRLKKWRVTKPSRQTRKKSEEAIRDPVRETPSAHHASSPEDQTRSRPSPTATGAPAAEPEWCMTNGAYEPHGLPSTIPLNGQNNSPVWASTSSRPSPLDSPINSHASSHESLSISTSNSYFPQSSPLADGALLSPTPAMTPTYADGYPLQPDSCIQTPVSTTTTAFPATAWAVPQWYSIPMETSHQPHSMPFYSAGPLTPPIDPIMHMMHPQTDRQISQSPHDGLRSWKPTTSVHYGVETTGQMSQKVQQPLKSLERKAGPPSRMATGHPPAGVVTSASPYFPHGQPTPMCSPAYR
ncbi:hypothetical protein BJX61DRAFT_471446 [Aspergillus egyptiacus]|nr:hypothetical protein BJX61DRAFT_471446 [Aspergillus egyptiacus]